MSQDKPPQMLRLSTNEQLPLSTTVTEVSQWTVGSRYILLILIWSSTPLAVVLSIRDLHPVWALSIRFVLAALLAYVICRIMGLRLPRHALAWQSYMAGSLSLLGAMLLTYLAASYLASGLISLLFGFSPLVAGLMAYLFNREYRLFVEQWLGMLLAVLGLAFICLTGERSLVQPIGVGLIFLAVLCYVGSMFWVKQLQANLHPLIQTTGSLVISAVGMLLLLPFFWQHLPSQLPSTLTIVAVIYTVVVASIIAMLCYFDLVQRLSPSTVALTTVLTPALALIWGSLFNHEHFTLSTLWGVVIILLGMLLYFIREWLGSMAAKSAI